MRLTTTTNLSVDGVMQGLGGPDEDRSGGFDRGGWAIPLLDAETGDYLNQVYGDAAAFLFGRRTFSETDTSAFKASLMGFIDSVDTMILGANTYAQSKD